MFSSAARFLRTLVLVIAVVFNALFLDASVETKSMSDGTLALSAFMIVCVPLCVLSILLVVTDVRKRAAGAKLRVAMAASVLVLCLVHAGVLFF